ncbi:ABC transporter permease [uncultured Paludibaculum sp.]|uniref:ABC transporter permease n=1 Tax=uncultured Paludibaculum sp. TaxID=1765020 RepID=UPI002AABB305|nr:ABC transporter permease [uncultured Paludibaculum sp.]
MLLLNSMSAVLRDLLFACRVLRKSPGFTSIALLTLAFGIGANTALFSIVQAVLLRPLPYPEPERIVALWERNPRLGFERELVTPGDFADWSSETHVFTAIGYSPAWPGARLANLVGTEGTERIAAAYASSGYFDVIGIKPVLGRTFRPEEDASSSAPVALLSYSLWRDRFGGDLAVLGRSVVIDSFHRSSVAVVGVMPEGFQFPEKTEIWLSAGQMGVTVPPPGSPQRGGPWLEVIGRLAKGRSIGQAQAELSQIAQRLSTRYPQDRVGSDVNVVQLRDQLVRSSKTALLVLFGAVGVVLLIACANMAGLLLARSSARRKELTVRAALGARRRDLLRQVLSESILIALLGGVCDVLLSAWSVDAVKHLLGESIPRLSEATLDIGVLTFAAAVTVGAGILFGAVPALYSSRIDLNAALTEGRSAGASVRHKHFREYLVIGEIALAVMLVSATGVLLRSLVRLQDVDPGFRSEGVSVFSLDMSSSTYSDDAHHTPQQFFSQLLEKVAALPGVQSAGGTSLVPLEVGGWEERPGSGWSNQVFAIEGRPAPANPAAQAADPRVVTPGYFETLGIPLRAGRPFAHSDGANAPAVALVNETMARQYWPGESPLGRRFRFNRESDRIVWHEIVGVVGDVRSARLEAQARPEFYLPYTQAPWHDAELVVRGHGNRGELASALRAQIKMLDRNVPVTRVRTLSALLDDATLQPRFRTGLLSGFALLALLLSAMGVYGVLSQIVEQRTREIGVRMALGADSVDVFRSLVIVGMRMTLIGIALGFAGTLALGRVLEGLLFRVRASDGVVLSVTVVVLITVGIVASYAPGRRASRVDPMVCLRYE